ncbi:MAG TPA: IclR family transcriptional regulator [Euzebya sp.]|nr:IclR family transcriptional regulator [Euzebya sp.]
MIQSVDRAVRILLELQGARRLGLTEMASRLGLANSTVHGILQTLVARGMVEQDSAGRYVLGAGVLRLGNVYLDSNELRLRSLSWAEALANRSGCAVRVGVPLAQDVVVIHHVLRPDGTPQMRETGIAIPGHAGAMGKTLLAFRPDLRSLLEGDSPLPRLTGQTIASLEELDESLKAVRLAGFSTGQDEVVIGESEIAAPIFDAEGTAVGAVAVVVPSLDWPLPESGAHAVREAAVGISRSMGAPTWPVLAVPDERAG